ncbi:MAG: heavy metal-responsive transcriptional regulator [Acidimicrobiia bacterium]
MLIGELAAKSGVPARTIRFYEDKGILPDPARTTAGYRDYDVADVFRLRFVRSAQDAGLRLAEIRSILAIRSEGEAPCQHTMVLLEAKRVEIASRLEHLGALQTELDRMLEAGHEIGPETCDPDAICSIVPRR